MIHLPTLNALLNTTTTALLIAGFVFIRRKNIPAHRFCMSTAFVVSTVFLISYLTHHAIHGSTRFLGTGLPRTIYFTILLTHTVLAAAIVPMVMISLFKAWKGQFERHRAWARWTWPLWLYVSITGVVIYWMLYRMSWA
jgi:putative membrane protein